MSHDSYVECCLAHFAKGPFQSPNYEMKKGIKGAIKNFSRKFYLSYKKGPKWKTLDYKNDKTNDHLTQLRLKYGDVIKYDRW